MRLVQFISSDHQRRVGLVQENGAALQVLRDTSQIYDLALEVDKAGCGLETLVKARLSDQVVDYEQVVAEKRLLPPLDHPHPARCYVTGTGLTHLGSAQARDEMNLKGDDGAVGMTDSMRMFRWGLEGGKPPAGQVGVQPEWFYKGNGTCIVSPEQPLALPAFALGGGEEAELVGLYVIAGSGAVLRVGFALGNEFSDHVMERQNYLYVAHAKLRACSIGPELLVGEIPQSIAGNVRIVRDGQEVWAGTFMTGEANMSHSIANLEHHHFKYPVFRQPGDVHCHFFGADIFSSAVGVAALSGDVFEISAPLFGRPLRNPLVQVGEIDRLIKVQPL